MPPRTTNDEPARARPERIREIVDSCLSRWAAGESFSEAMIVQSHPDLMPELGEELRKIRLITAAGARETPPREVGDTRVEENPSNRMPSTTRQQGSSGSRSLHVRCPHCHEPMELLTDSPFTDITCVSCGGSFSLTGDAHTRETIPLKTVGHFELLARLGLGSFGTVWKAYDTELDRTVAIKIPRKGQLELADEEQFLREARVAAGLKHANIVAVHEVGRDGDSLYIVSDLIRGVSLSDWLTAKRPTYQESAELCAKIADALGHAHEEGVVHRDLKPSNILLDRHDEPHITDFGLAKRDVGDITMTVEGQVLGTPAYMSPELAVGEGHTADRRTDLYSFGVILFQLITGELPFRGNAQMMIHQAIHEEPPSPRKLVGGVPRDLETICLRCLEKEPRKRYDYAEDVAAELRRFLRNEPILARPISRLDRTVRWCRRNPLGTWVAGLVLLIAVAAPIVAVTQMSLAAAAQRSAEDANEKAEQARKQEELARKQERRTRRALYVAHMAMAQLAWEAEDIPRVRHLLDSELPVEGREDLRSFEWYYWWRRSHAHRSLAGHQKRVSSVDLSPDGTTIASASNDKTIKLWDVATGQLKATLEGHELGVSAIAYDPSGTRLASAGADKTVRLWDAKTGQPQGVLGEHDRPITALAFSPDGKLLATGTTGEVLQVWEVDSGARRAELKGHAFYITALRFSPKGELLASASFDKTIKLWDLEKQEARATLSGHGGVIHTLAFSQDGKTLASGSQDRTVRLWDVAEAKQIANPYDHQNSVSSVLFTPDGKMLISTSADRTIRVWDRQAKKTLAVLKGHDASVTSADIAADSLTLITGSEDKTVRIWKLRDAAGLANRLQGHAAPVTRLAYSRDGQLLVSAGTDGQIILWNSKTRQPIDRISAHENLVWSITFSPDDKLFASGGKDGTIHLVNVATRERRTLGTAGKADDSTDDVMCVAFAPDSKTLAAGIWDGTVRLYEVATGKILATLEAETDHVATVAYSPDGKRLAVGGSAMNIWDVERREIVGSFKKLEQGVGALTYTPRGALVLGFVDGSLALWLGGEADPLRYLAGSHEMPVTALSIAPDGRTLASCSNQKPTIRIWDLETGELKATLGSGSQAVTSVAFSPSENVLASAVHDHTLRLWQGAEEEEVAAAAEP